MSTSCANEEQSRRREDSAVDGPEGGAGHEEGHDPRHDTEQPVPERLKQVCPVLKHHIGSS